MPTRLETSVGFVERTSDPRTYFYTKANKHNDYLRDYEAEKTKLVCGVPPIGNLQDRAMTELMSNEKGEVIYDRSHEHLGTLDIMVIAVRRQLLKRRQGDARQRRAAAQRRQRKPSTACATRR